MIIQICYLYPYIFNTKVSLAPRDICSRMNTFMLETEKPATREDKESLVVVKVSRWDIVKTENMKIRSDPCFTFQGEDDPKASLVC